MTEKLRDPVNPNCKDYPEDKQWKEWHEPNMRLNEEVRLVEEEPTKSFKDTHPLDKPLETVTLSDILNYALACSMVAFMIPMAFFYLKIGRYPPPETLELALEQSAKFAVGMAIIVTGALAIPVILKKRFKLPEKIILIIMFILCVIIRFYIGDILPWAFR